LQLLQILGDNGEEIKMKKLLKFIFWPLIMLKNILDANWWANKIADKTNMEEKIQGSRFNRWQNSLPQPYRFIFKTSMLIICIYFIEMYFNLIDMSMLPWRWDWS
jgi:hypothetical protein